MKRLVGCAALALALAGPLACLAQAAEDDVQVAERLRAQFPRYSFSKVEKSPVAGIYTVFGEKNITYYAAQTGHLFVGNLWSPDGQNLTEIAMAQIAKDLLATLPLDKAVRIGEGPHVVIEVTDPDCPFCRKGSQYFAQRKDVTRYVFFMPLAQLHPQAEVKCRYILSADDPAKAYQEVMAGQFDNRPLPDFKDNDLLSEHLRVASLLGVRGTPNYWANGVAVSGADTAKLDQLLR
ncbi:DsbC family protein [Geoalkalibacter sp.]|uniref:DsbC family protein n=1 Tax=Geoalkalibacter sp. TaxID=3041440 RepID=UPI00272DDA48|nr:DsbC family protein [Geoalkalibacter sp.]